MIAKDLNTPPPQSKGSQLHESFAHPWVAVKIISRTPYYHPPKYYHAHDNERGGGFSEESATLYGATQEVDFDEQLLDANKAIFQDTSFSDREKRFFCVPMARHKL